MIKLVVSDMDGTLLDDNHNINEEFWDVLKELQVKGVKFVSASGRQYYSLVDKLSQVKDEIIFVAENGGYAREGAEVLYSNPFKEADVKDLLEVAEGIHSSIVVLCGEESAYVTEKNPDFLELLKEYYSRYEVVEDFSDVNDNILKVTLLDSNCSESNCYPHYKHLYEDYQVTVSGKVWLDIVPKNSSKGTVIGALQDRYDIKASETMVFGDYLNDLSMFNQAKYSYAMKNAHEDLKASAYEVIGCNNSNSVVKKLKELLLTWENYS